jgi:hypothetical protein
MITSRVKLLSAIVLVLVAAVALSQALRKSGSAATAAPATGDGSMANMPGPPGMGASGTNARVARAAMMGDMNMAGTSYLYVWVGDAARTAPDRLAAIDFRRSSPDYGKVVGWALVPGSGGIDNEPHHCMIAMSMRMIACGGLLSVLRHQPGLFFFDISDPAHPRYLFSRRTKLSAITDDLRPLPDGGYLVTDLGSASGGTPGRLVELNARMQITHEWPNNPPAGFNPHGISISWNHNLMLTSDLFDPASTLNVTPGPIVYRGSIRVWDFKQRRIIRTITIPGAPGTMDVKFIPHDPLVRAYTAGVNDGLLYLLNPVAGTERPVFNLDTIDAGAAPQVMVVSPDGRRLFIPMDSRRGSEIVMLDITRPAEPRLLDALELGAAHPHDSLLTRDHRLVLTDYFLNEDGFGKVHVDGDHRVLVFLVGSDSLRLDPRFNLDFNDVLPGLHLRPHGTDAL